ncbi:MAG: hypothetical protein R3B48_23605 [Kofleriaceae bacterium]
MNSRKWRILQAAKRKALRWLARPEVVSVGIGQRHREGRWRSESCIVVKIDWKRSREQLRDQRQRPLPSWIDVVVDGQLARVGVDLQETAGETLGRLQARVGSPVRHDGKAIGSVSAMVLAGGARRALISGHVAKAKGRRVQLGDVSGVTDEPVRTRRLDHCLVELDDDGGAALSSLSSLCLDGSALTGLRAVPSLVLGQTLYFHRMVTGHRVPVLLRHVDMTVPFWTPEGILHMQGLVATDGRTAEGDSGAMLHDDTFRAVGTLVGSFAGESYFIPCDYAFAALGLQLA